MRTGGILCLLVVAGLAVGCGASRPASSMVPPTRPDVPVAHLTIANRNEQQLAALWAARYGKHAEFPIGPGDVLQISVPGLDELKQRTVRVTEDGDISLPLLGDIHVAGLSEDGVRRQLLSRLRNYMYHPQVDLFVKTFNSRQAGVLGEVRNPAMYTLNGPADTIREMIQRAGGITDRGAQEILFTPSESATMRKAAETGSPGQASVRQAAFAVPEGLSTAANTAEKNSEPRTGITPTDALSYHDGTVAPLVIDLAPGSHDERYLEMPVMPGDTIYVPRAGQVTVVGWVYYPKVIQITPGLTVLGAVSAAGGPLYAGDMTSVKVIRQGAYGQPTVFTVNLNRVKERAAPDIPVRANDVVEVGYSTLRLPGYAVYYALQGVFMWAPAAMVTQGIP